MSKVKIVTDTTSCIPEEILKQYGISLVPVGLVIDGAFYRDCIDINLETICNLLPSFKKQPSTTAISPGDFLQIYKELSQTTDNIVCILVSKAMSATQESAYLARRLFRAENPRLKIEIIDSKTSGGALGFLAMAAARAAEEGKNITEIVGMTTKMVNRVVYLSAIDTLKYLINMGRTVKGASSLGEALDIKPVLGMVDDSGLAEILARARGKQKSIEKVVNLIPKYVDVKKPLHANVHYSVCREDAEQLKDMILSRYKCAEMYVTPFSPVMVSSTGPMVGVGFYADNQ